MIYTSAVTQKGQITLPKNIRDKLNIKVRQKVEIEINKNHIEIFPTFDILTIAGYLKTKVKTPGDILNSRENLGREYIRV